MPQITITTTAEDLHANNWSGVAEIEVTFDLCAPEPQTRNYPGSPGTVEVVDWAVVGVDIYNCDGIQIFPPSWGEFVPAIAQWIDDNDSQLVEDAIEAEAARCEEWRY